MNGEGKLVYQSIRRATCILICLGYVPFLYAQYKKVSEKQLLTLFENSINKNYPHDIDSSPWTICNLDSSFYKSDTLKIVNSYKYPYNVGKCCRYMNWSFYKIDSLVQHESNSCNEPTYSVVPRKNDWYKLFLRKGRHGLFVILKNIDGIKDVFRIVGRKDIEVLDIGEKAPMIVLYRIRDYRSINVESLR